MGDFPGLPPPLQLAFGVVMLLIGLLAREIYHLRERAHETDSTLSELLGRVDGMEKRIENLERHYGHTRGAD